jgi:hypothetical protein
MLEFGIAFNLFMGLREEGWIQNCRLSGLERNISRSTGAILLAITTIMREKSMDSAPTAKGVDAI